MEIQIDNLKEHVSEKANSVYIGKEFEEINTKIQNTDERYKKLYSVKKECIKDKLVL